MGLLSAAELTRDNVVVGSSGSVSVDVVDVAEDDVEATSREVAVTKVNCESNDIDSEDDVVVAVMLNVAELETDGRLIMVPFVVELELLLIVLEPETELLKLPDDVMLALTLELENTLLLVELPVGAEVITELG